MRPLVGAKANTDDQGSLQLIGEEQKIADSHHDIGFLINRIAACVVEKLF